MDSHDLTVYKGYSFSNEIIDEILSLLDFVIKNTNFENFLDLYYFISKYKQCIDLVLERIDFDDEDEQLNIQNLLRSRTQELV